MRKISLVVATLLVVGLVAVPAQAYRPPGGGTFNAPKHFGGQLAQYRILRTVEKAINRTFGPTKRYPKPVILISTYLLDRTRSVDALVAACRRGVSVRVILDEDIVNRNSKRLIRVLNGDNVRDRNDDGVPDSKPDSGRCNRPLKKGRTHVGPLTDQEARRSVRLPTEASVTWGKDASYVKRCDGSCRGKGGNMHSKFYAFKRTGGSRHVVMVSSSNLNRGGAELGWNDLFTMKDRPTSFRAYLKIHRAMTDDDAAGDKRVEFRDGRFTSRFFPMRRARRGNDPTLDDLNKIRCHGPLGRTQVNISMFYWKGSRGNYLADKLFDLARAGCKVSIIYGAPSVQIAERLREAAGRNLINLYDSRWDFNDDGFNEIRTHAKYVLVKGRFGRDRKSWQVMTGTQNWVAGSLSRGDENTLNIASRTAWRQYIRNWNTIRNRSRVLPYH